MDVEDCPVLQTTEAAQLLFALRGSCELDCPNAKPGGGREIGVDIVDKNGLLRFNRLGSEQMSVNRRFRLDGFDPAGDHRSLEEFEERIGSLQIFDRSELHV